MICWCKGNNKTHRFLPLNTPESQKRLTDTRYEKNVGIFSFSRIQHGHCLTIVNGC